VTRRPVPAPARAREAVEPYLPQDPDAPTFARILETYSRCLDDCQDRIAGERECSVVCRRAIEAKRRGLRWRSWRP